MAAQKFHINPETGNVNICRATKACRFGDSSVHYSSREEAQLSYEDSQSAALFGEAPDPASMLNRNGYLKQKYAKLAAPRGISCPKCGRATSTKNGHRLISSEWARCSCGKLYDERTARVELTADNPSRKFLVKEEVLKATWYHATNEPHWLEVIEDTGSPFEVHVGTESAAFDRAITEYAPHSSFAKDFYIYEVELDPDSKIADEVSRDENNAVLKDSESDVARYINLWEDMASISLATKPSAIRIKSRRLVKVKEAHSRISLYNVDPDS